MARAIILVLDSLGIGSSADAERFGDSGADPSDTLQKPVCTAKVNLTASLAGR